MSGVTLTSPFPEASLPSAFVWLQPYLSLTKYYGRTLAQFVEEKRKQAPGILTWSVSVDGEIGGRIEFMPESSRVGFVDYLAKPFFFRQEIAQPAITQALDAVFEGGADLILFAPLSANRKFAHLVRTLGATDAGMLKQNGIPERRVLSIGSGDWERRNVQ